MLEKKMKAFVMTGPNQYEIQDVDTPVIVEPTDVIAKVTLATICRSDVHCAAAVGYPGGIPANSIFGHEFCCTVVEAGPEVKNVKVGDRYVAYPAASCGSCPTCNVGLYASCLKYGCYGVQGGLKGAYAEYIRIPMADRNLMRIPDHLTEEDAIYAGDVLATGYFAVERTEAPENGTVAVFGCGPIGMGAMITAKKIRKASLVIAVDTNQERLDLIKSTGYVDATVNSSQEDPVAKIKDLTQGWGVDGSVDSVGIDATMNAAVSSLRPGGGMCSFALRDKPWNVDWNQVVQKNLTLRAGVSTMQAAPVILDAIAKGEIDARFMSTHKAPLNDLAKGFDVFGNYKDGCIKWLVTPYEH